MLGDSRLERQLWNGLDAVIVKAVFPVGQAEAGFYFDDLTTIGTARRRKGLGSDGALSLNAEIYDVVLTDDDTKQNENTDDCRVARESEVVQDQVAERQSFRRARLLNSLMIMRIFMSLSHICDEEGGVVTRIIAQYTRYASYFEDNRSSRTCLRTLFAPRLNPCAETAKLSVGSDGIEEMVSTSVPLSLTSLRVSSIEFEKHKRQG